jgi:hypothetical protein
MQSVLFADFPSRFCLFNMRGAFNTPRVLNASCIARTPPCARLMARAGSC